MKKSAFTLLELLVVIGIIAILVSIAMVSYGTAQKKARDAKRRGDLHAAQNVMEQCYSASSTFSYPTISGTGTITASCTVNGVTTSFSITDPKNTTPNIYSYTQSSPVGTTYSITAQLETDSANPFVVSNQQ